MVSPWGDHACDLCRKITPVEGEDFLTHAAAIDDGNVSTRFFKVSPSFAGAAAKTCTVVVTSSTKVVVGWAICSATGREVPRFAVAVRAPDKPYPQTVVPNPYGCLTIR